MLLPPFLAPPPSSWTHPPRSLTPLYLPPSLALWPRRGFQSWDCDATGDYMGERTVEAKEKRPTVCDGAWVWRGVGHRLGLLWSVAPLSSSILVVSCM